jgi:DNA-binding GntR family transcriptional regulator
LGTTKKKTSLSEEAYRRIRASVLSLELSPGTRINEAKIEADLSIGRTPIREALLRLAAEGFVMSAAGYGFFVRAITMEDARALLEAMMILERGAVVLAAKRASPAHIDKLIRINGRLQEAMQEKRFLEIALINSNFHQVIYDASNNAFLNSSLKNCRAMHQRLAYLCFSQKMHDEQMKEYFNEVHRQHRDIIDRLSKGEETGAVETVTEHIKLFYQRVFQYLSPPLESILLPNESLQAVGQ